MPASKNCYKQPIPYRFTCNYCGEVTQKSYDINVSVKASGSAQNVGGVRREADRQHDKQVKKEVTAKKREIEKYRQKLVAGESVTDKKLWRIPLNSECAHCGKHQINTPAVPPPPAADTHCPLPYRRSFGKRTNKP